MPVVQVSGQQLFYTRSGSRQPDSPALVLIHGAGGNHLHWPPQLRRLPGVTVYAVDLPGHGRSKGPGRDTVRDYAAVLAGFLDAAGTKQAVLMGHSMGGAIAQMTALAHPERVAGLVLIGTGARLRVTPAILEGIWSDFDNAIDVITRYAWAESAPAKLTQRGRKTLAETPPIVLHGDFAACDGFDIMPHLNEIEVPALVIAGTTDHLTPHKYGVFLAEHMPRARLVTVEGGGHMMALEQPEVVAAAVAQFVEELRTAGTA